MKLLKMLLVLFVAAACTGGEVREGDQLFEAGKYQQAIQAYNEYLSSHQADIATLYNRGRSYEEVGKYGLALKDFEEVIKMDKRNVNAHLSMAKVYYVGDWAVQLGPVYAETSFNHAPKGLDFINYGKWFRLCRNQ